MTSRRTLETRKIALTATLAALYTVFRAVPVSRLIGISGFITAGGMIAPVLGVLLEPSYGAVAVFVGTILASFIPGNGLRFYGLDFLPGAANVVLVSLIARGRRKEAALLFLVMIALFLINPFTEVFVGANLGSPPVPYLWLHFVAVVFLVSPFARNVRGRLSSGTSRDVLIGVFVLAFTGTMIEHVTGGVLFASVLGKGALFAWPAIFIVYPIERAVIVAGSLVACPLVVLSLRPLRDRLGLKEAPI